MELDFLVLAAHPDDAELHCGGTLIKLREKGYHTGVIDFSRGEAGTTGSMEEREKETGNANEILQLSFRHNLGLPDSRLRDDDGARRAVVDIIRQYRVQVLVAPVSPCRHPDHNAVHQVARSTYFFSGAGKFPSEHAPWRPQRLLFHPEFAEMWPSFVIDISGQFKAKMRAVEAYATQFYSADNKDEKTVVGSKRFRERMISRFKYYGNLIGCDYGEPYITEDMNRIEDPIAMS